MSEKFTKSTVVLHWVSGAILVFLLLSGTFVLSEMPNTVEKISSFRIHMLLGILAVLLSIVRIINIYKTSSPKELEMSSFRAKMMRYNHIAIYAVIIAIGLSGILFARGSSLGEIVFFGADKAIYTSMKDFTMGIAHGFLTKVLIALIIMHVVGVFAYIFKTKTNIVKRMWF